MSLNKKYFPISNENKSYLIMTKQLNRDDEWRKILQKLNERVYICYGRIWLTDDKVMRKTSFRGAHRVERSSRGRGRGMSTEERREENHGEIKEVVDTSLMSDRYHDENAVSNRFTVESRFLSAPFIRLPISWRLPRNLLSPHHPIPLSFSRSFFPFSLFSPFSPYSA